MDVRIKQIIDSQIAKQQTKPNQTNIVPYSCLFEYDKNGTLNLYYHELICLPRVIELFQIVNNFKIKNTAFLLYTHDITTDFSDNCNYSLCFAKLKFQNFITIPNNHILNGVVDNFLNDTNINDISLSQKMPLSIFIGGAHGGINGPRFKYLYSGVNKAYHHIAISNSYLLSIKDQLKYLFLINIDGNGPCYDRLYWQLNSNSIPIYLDRNKEIIHLHDELLIPNYHYIDCDINNWDEVFLQLLNNNQILDISKNGKQFIKEQFGQSAQNVGFEIMHYVVNSISEKQNENI